jgi:mono/diheme cytochrome c family protein
VASHRAPFTLASILALLALTVAAAGCGGDSGDTVSQSTRPSDTTASPQQPLSAEERRGKTLFVQNCGTCHALKAAGTTGSIGPSLDEAQVDEAEVLEKIKQGPGPMPSNLVSGKDAQAVAKFVASSGPGV